MKIGLISLGCPKNLVDSEVTLGLAQQAGHELTQDPASADVLVVNTCAFIDSAKQESIDAILDMARHKQDGACRRLIVTGCMAERYRDELRREIPEIDAVLGTGEVPQIVDAIAGVPPDRSPLTFFRAEPQPAAPLAAAAVRPSYIYDADTPRMLATPRHYAYVKIAEGCDYKCAFCIIPTLRGAYRSRPAESILQEARALAGRGVKELLLISQDTTFYGIDRQERGALARLLRALDQVDGLEWIRLLYLYPTTIDDETLAAMADCEKICKYIDLPLQHASNAVLKRMKRPGTRQGYDRLLNGIRARVPGVALRTTFIVGFPGETERDVEELAAFVDDHRFDHVGVRIRRRRARCREEGAPEPRDGPAEAARSGPPALPDWRAGPNAGGWPGRRARSGPQRTARVAGARHRRGGVPDGMRPVELSNGRFCRGRDRGRARLRPDRPSRCVIILCFEPGVEGPKWACAHFLRLRARF